MATATRKKIGDKECYVPIASKTWFFLNGELVRVIAKSRQQNICKIYSDVTKKTSVLLYTEFMKKRERAYTIGEICRMFEVNRLTLTRGVTKGYIPKGYIKYPERGYPWKPGERGYRGGPNRTIYYAESQLFEIREGWANMPRGRPRDDGITDRKKKWLPTEAELNVILGRGMMLYAQGRDGEFIPVWSERSWD